MHRLHYDATAMTVYWYFNVYDSHQCNTSMHGQQNHSNLLKLYPNIRIAEQPTLQSRFWSTYLEPSKIERQFATPMDYLWLPDWDLMLEMFNFNAFLKLASHFNTSIVQPSIMSLCENCRGSDWVHLNHHQDNLDNALVAYTSPIVEVMAPLFPFAIWSTLHPFVEYHYMYLNHDLQCDWGMDLLWCGIVEYIGGGPCVVIQYTPLIHMDTNAIAKTDEYDAVCGEVLMRDRRDAIFSRFFVMPKTYTVSDGTQFFMSEFVQDHSAYFQ